MRISSNLVIPGCLAEPVIGPAEGRTRWLCPPYKSDGIDMDHEGIDQARAVGSS